MFILVTYVLKEHSSQHLFMFLLGVVGYNTRFAQTSYHNSARTHRERGVRKRQQEHTEGERTLTPWCLPPCCVDRCAKGKLETSPWAQSAFVPVLINTPCKGIVLKLTVWSAALDLRGTRPQRFFLVVLCYLSELPRVLVDQMAGKMDPNLKRRTAAFCQPSFVSWPDLFICLVTLPPA